MWFSKRRIYLDHASAPPVLPEAIAAIREAEKFIGNPGAIHAEAVVAKKCLEDSRARVARMLECKPREVIFTSGLTESNNLAILGFARHLERVKRTLKGAHFMVSSIEHDSVLASFAEVECMGADVSFVEPNEKGIITPEIVAAALRPETVFLSVGWANNELGTIQPLAKISQVLAKKEGERIVFHSDAGQAPLYLPTLVHSLGVDMLSLGSNKLYGPHGVGALFLSNAVSLVKVLQGGAQERGVRPGTENVSLAAGFAAAYEQIAGERTSEGKRVQGLRNDLAKALQAKVPGLIVNGDLAYALPHMLNVSIPTISSEYFALALDARGIAVSTKSACREGEESRSHVVAALGGPSWRAKNTIRISLGRDTRDSDIGRIAEEMERLLRTLAT